jgi:NADH:ubiquinone oxidoreductase subunit 5 (subunit L)/multisubunit Na+/H+ antiporter MnhA subunit
MPLTFASFLIAALAISGIPPFNGFVSKWMVYQGVVEMGSGALTPPWFHQTWIIWLVAAMFGSGLTLAGLMKLTNSVFLGVPSKKVAGMKIREAGTGMLVPVLILALLCVVFGVFAFLPVENFLAPVMEKTVSGAELPNFRFWQAGTGTTSQQGFWNPGLATAMILLGLVVGVIIYLLGNMKFREADSFVGGETLPAEDRVTGGGFYETIREMGFLKRIYTWAEAGYFDIYELGMRASNSVSGILKRMHTGVLNTYILWFLIGLIVFLVVLILR